MLYNSMLNIKASKAFSVCILESIHVDLNRSISVSTRKQLVNVERQK